YAYAIWSSDTPVGEAATTEPFEAFLEEVGDSSPHCAAIVHRLLAELRQVAADIPAAAHHLERAQELSRDTDDPALAIDLAVCAAGNLGRAVELGTTGRRVAAGSGDAQTTSIAVPALAWAHAMLGHHTDALRELDDWSGLGSELVPLLRAAVHALAGDPDEA